jgi:hypothetical protein
MRQPATSTSSGDAFFSLPGHGRKEANGAAETWPGRADETPN